MKANVDSVLFKCYEYFNDKVTVAGEELIIDPSFDRERHASIWGVATQVPVRLTDRPVLLSKEHDGFPGYGPATGYSSDFESSNAHVLYSDWVPKFYKVSDIAPEVLPGDKIYFHYTTLLNEDNFITDNLIDLDGQRYDIWKVRYDQIICAIRKVKAKRGFRNEWVMIGGYCLVVPKMEDWDDILKPIYYDPSITGGKKVLKPKEEWLQVKVRPEGKYLEGIVKHAGTPMIGSGHNIKAGDHIIYRPEADFEVQIEGKKFFAIRQNHIEAVFDK